MASDLQIQGEVVVNSEQAEGAFNRVGDQAAKMANEVATSAGKAGQAVDKIGDGAGASAEKFTRAESRISASIKRATNELELLGKTASQRLEFNIADKGLDPAKFEPALIKLREIEAQSMRASVAANGSLNSMGMSAKQTAAALRGVPAQFTDIVTSLQGGQAPMTVLLQQGGQLRDMFGSVGGAARALGGAIAGMVNPFTIIGATAATFGYAAYQASEDVKALRLALIETGTQGVTSLAKLDTIAGNLNALGVSTSVASAALVEFVNAGVKVDDNLQDITKAAIDLSRYGGASVEETAKAFAALAKDPLADLSRLTLATYQQVESLLALGEKTEAAKLAQYAFTEATKNQAAAFAAQEGPIDRATRYWGDLAKETWDAAKALATALSLRDQSGSEELAALQAKRDRYKEHGYDTSDEDARLDYLKRANAAGEQTNKNLQRERELKTLLAAFDKNDDELQKLTKRNQLSADYKRLLDAHLISQERYDTAMKKLEDKPKKTAAAPKESLTEAQRALASYTGELQRRLEKEEKLTEVQKAQNFLSSLGATGQTAQVREFVLAAAQQVDALNETDAATKAATKAYQEHLREQEKVIDGYKRSADAVEKSLQKYADEEQAAVIAAEKNISLSEAIALVELARLRDLQSKKLAEGADGETLLAIQREIAAREKLADAIRRKESSDAASKAAKQAAADWKRAAEKIQDSITDALMRGFESGKGFAENLRDTVVNMFKSMVLRPIVEIGVRGGLSMLGMGGLSGAANAASSMASLGEGASMLSGLSGWLTDFGGSVASTVSSMGRSIADLSEIGGSFGSTFDSVGTSLMDVSASVGKYAGIVGNGLGYLNAAIAASEGKWGKAVGTGIGTYFGGPIGAAIGGTIGGWVDDAFGGGREYTTGTGISGRFSGSSFDGRNYQDWRNDGSSGFFGIGASGSSSGTNYSAMGAAQQKSLGLAYGNLLAQTAGFATALGANAASITGYQKDIKLALGTDAEANKKAIAAMFKGIADEVAAVVLDSRFMREGEGAADTLARLATNLTTVNGALDTLGDNLLTVSQSSGDAASSLVDAFGGLQAYQSAIGNYYQRFYTQEERLAKTREQLGKQMDALGLSVPDSTAAFRDLVNAQDLSTEAGRKTYTALIGMSSAFADITDAAQSAQLKLSDVAKSLQTLLQSVTSARESVAGARNEVNPAPVMDASSIRAAVLVATTSASTAAMNAAAQDLGAKTVAASQSSAALTTAQTMAEAKAELLAAAVTDNAALVAKYKTAATTAQNLATGYGMSINSSKATSTFANDAYSYDPKTNQVNDFNNFGYRTWSNSLITKIGDIVVGSATTSYNTLVNKQSLQNALRGNSPGYTYQPGSGTYEAGSLIDILSGANTKLAEQSKKIAEAQAASAAAQAALTTATTNKAAADAAAKAAATEYTKAVDAWTAEASKSVPQLTKLRDETLRYYEAQKALAEGMATSAANLRAAVAAARATQLDPLASAQQQQRDFAKNYALALSTTGAVQAGYADKLAAALPTLSEALKATQSTGDWTATMARLFAQSNAIADQLDANAPKDFQAESLGLLDSIDSALTVLDDSTRAITRAIEASGGVTAAGLRAVVSTLGGVPSFDVGTNYVPRDMFARIHEGEAIVPKAYNPFRSGSMGAGLGDTSRLEALVEQQAQQLAALRAELRAITIHTANTAENTRSMDKNGVLVFNDPQAPIETKVVPA